MCGADNHLRYARGACGNQGCRASAGNTIFYGRCRIKHFPSKPGITISSVLENDNELQRKYEDSEDVRKLIDTALQVEGYPRHGSTHAAGVVITEAPSAIMFRFQKNDDIVVTQFQKNEVEQLGLLKLIFGSA